MTDEQPKQPIQSAPVRGKVTPESPAESEANTSALDQQSDVNKLTAEEQMALFEKDLKENDWGHQPC